MNIENSISNLYVKSDLTIFNYRERMNAKELLKKYQVMAQKTPETNFGLVYLSRRTESRLRVYLGL